MTMNDAEFQAQLLAATLEAEHDYYGSDAWRNSMLMEGLPQRCNALGKNLADAPSGMCIILMNLLVLPGLILWCIGLIFQAIFVLGGMAIFIITNPTNRIQRARDRAGIKHTPYW